MKLFSVIAFTLCAFASGAWAAEAPPTHEAPATHEATDTLAEGAIVREPQAGGKKDDHGNGHSEGEHGVSHAEKPYDLNIVKQPVSDIENGTRPAIPKLQSPEALAKVGTNVTLKWGEVKGATVYHIQVATDPNFKWLIVDEANFPQTSFQPQGLTAGQNYFWRVAARKPGNYASYTKSFFASSSFLTK